MIINLLTNYELADIEIIPDQGSTAVALDHGITQFNNTFVHLVLIELNSRFDLDLLLNLQHRTFDLLRMI